MRALPFLPDVVHHHQAMWHCDEVPQAIILIFPRVPLYTVTVIKCDGQKQLGKGVFGLLIPIIDHYSPRRSQGRNCKAGTETKMEENTAYWLALGSRSATFLI